jgi:hypothetical protein
MAYEYLRLPSQYFAQFEQGKALSLAQIFVGEVDTDPQIVENQKQVRLVLEDGSTVDVSQPVRTGSGGVVTYEGSPAVIMIDGDYSIKILDSAGVQKYYFAEILSSGDAVGTPSSYPMESNGKTAEMELIGSESDGSSQIDFDINGDPFLQIIDDQDTPSQHVQINKELHLTDNNKDVVFDYTGSPISASSNLVVTVNGNEYIRLDDDQEGATDPHIDLGHAVRIASGELTMTTTGKTLEFDYVGDPFGASSHLTFTVNGNDFIKLDDDQAGATDPHIDIYHPIRSTSGELSLSDEGKTLSLNYVGDPLGASSNLSIDIDGREFIKLDDDQAGATDPHIDLGYPVRIDSGELALKDNNKNLVFDYIGSAISSSSNLSITLNGNQFVVFDDDQEGATDPHVDFKHPVRINGLDLTTESYADAGDAETLVSANAYTDGEVAGFSYSNYPQTSKLGGFTLDATYINKWIRMDTPGAPATFTFVLPDDASYAAPADTVVGIKGNGSLPWIIDYTNVTLEGNGLITTEFNSTATFPNSSWILIQKVSSNRWQIVGYSFNLIASAPH